MLQYAFTPIRGSRRSGLARSVLMLSCLILSVLGCGEHQESAPIEPADSALFPITAPTYPLRVQGRSLVDQTGAPFLWAGDTAWSLIVQLNDADAGTYLDDRRDKGFSIVLVNLIDRRFGTNAPANIYGQAPFTGPIFQGLPASANEAYFQHADFKIQAAADRGIAVLLDPLYLGYNCGAEGFCDALRAASAQDMERWAEYVGNRYRNFGNIVWVVGGDADPTPDAAKVRAFATRLDRLVGDRHPITAHNQPESFATSPWPNEAWLDLDNLYFNQVDGIYDRARTAYERNPVRPFFQVESRYEGEGGTAQTIRAVPYYAILGGGIGATFGNCPIWHFGSTPTWCNSGDWRAALNSAGSNHMRIMHALFRSRAFELLLPDFSNTIITAGALTGANRAVAAATSDRRTLIAYVPTQRTITVRMDKVSGTSAKAWWANPETGTTTAVGTFATTGTRDFAPPASGDWVFVLDDAAFNLPAPGNPPVPPAGQPPTVATPAAATPSSTNAVSVSLSVQGADDGGVAALRYTWSALAAPSGAAPAFSPNGTNAARNTTVTFNAAGSYTLRATITDADNLSVTSDTTVVVQVKAQQLTLTPASATVSIGGTQQFTPSLRDQFGAAMTALTTWTVSGGGTISSSGLFTAGSSAGGPHQVTAQSAALSVQSTVTVNAAPTETVELGNSTSTTGLTGQNDFFSANRFRASSNASIDTMELYIRAGTGRIKLAVYSDSAGRPGSLLATGSEIASSVVGWNRAALSTPVALTSGSDYWLCFNVSSSSMSVALNTSGGTTYWRALAYSSSWPSQAGTSLSGPVADNFTIRALRTAPDSPANTAPTVATAAASNPSSVSGTTAALTALGADDKGEAALIYTWSAPLVPSGGTPSFSANATNAAKNSVVTFNRAGSYRFSVQIADAQGASVQSEVNVSVQQTLSTLTLSPASAQVSASGTQSFSAVARDQFAQTLGTSPTLTWATSGGGSISSAGLFTAGTSAGGPFTISASSGSVRGTASVTVIAVTDTTPPTGSIVINNGASSVSGSQVTLTLSASDPSGVSSMRISNGCSTFPSSIPYATQLTHTLTSGRETKTVCVQFRDGAGNWSGSFSDTIFRRR